MKLNLWILGPCTPKEYRKSKVSVLSTGNFTAVNLYHIKMYTALMINRKNSTYTFWEKSIDTV